MKRKRWLRRRDGHVQRYTTGRTKRKMAYFTGTDTIGYEGIVKDGQVNPRGGHVWFTKQPNYARLHSNIVSGKSDTEPVVLVLSDDDAMELNLEPRGRHFVTSNPVPVSKFSKVLKGRAQVHDLKNYGSSAIGRMIDDVGENRKSEMVLNSKSLIPTSNRVNEFYNQSKIADNVFDAKMQESIKMN